ncbi:hypothetical protein HYU07_00565 [Candidatus Woesearchaeota archaeon]|nr:hypothetical protein [Candidatus Woesearchaeota archaeon]
MKIFCDNITNLAFPEECDRVFICGHKILGDVLAEGSKVNGDIYMNEVKVGGIVMMAGLNAKGLYLSKAKVNGAFELSSSNVCEVEMFKLYVKKSVNINGARISGGLKMYGLRAKNVYARELVVGCDINMGELEVKSLDMRGLSANKGIYAGRTNIKEFYLSTKEGVIIQYLCLDEAKISNFISTFTPDEPQIILVKEFSKANARLPKSLEEALEKGVELAKNQLEKTNVAQVG